MDTTDLKTFTVCAAFYDQDCRATATVKARSYQDACEQVVAQIDDGTLPTHTRSFEPGPTFVYGVVEGDGDPFTGMANVPHAFQEPVGRPDLDPNVQAIVDAARAVIASSRPSTLTPALSRALDALAESLKPFPKTNGS